MSVLGPITFSLLLTYQIKYNCWSESTIKDGSKEYHWKTCNTVIMQEHKHSDNLLAIFWCPDVATATEKNRKWMRRKLQLSMTLQNANQGL